MNIETCEQKCIHFPWECALFLQNNKELATPLLEVAEYGKLNLLVSVCGYLSAFCSLAVIYFHLFCQGNWDSYVLHVIFSLSVLVCHLHTLEVLKLKKKQKNKVTKEIVWRGGRAAAGGTGPEDCNRIHSLYNF